MRWKLKMALDKARLNQIQLAHLTGLSEATISRIVCGYRNPSQDEKMRIAKALRVRPAEIWGEGDKGEPKR